MIHIGKKLMTVEIVEALLQKPNLDKIRGLSCEIISKDMYDNIVVYNDNKIVAKLYVHNNGLISNFRIRKKYRGNQDIIKVVTLTLERNYPHLNLYGYASPEDKSRRPALLRLYRMHGFVNITKNKVIFDPNGEYGW